MGMDGFVVVVLGVVGAVFVVAWREDWWR